MKFLKLNGYTDNVPGFKNIPILFSLAKNDQSKIDSKTDFVESDPS